jgi:hypothetical protein
LALAYILVFLVSGLFIYPLGGVKGQNETSAVFIIFVVSGFGMVQLDLSGLGFINACISASFILLNKIVPIWKWLQLMEFRFAKEILHIFYTFVLACLAWIFF